MSSPTFSSPTLYIVTGPTGVGKTAYTIELAQRWQVPIISADSRQFYKEMRIGTAFPTEEVFDYFCLPPPGWVGVCLCLFEPPKQLCCSMS